MMLFGIQNSIRIEENQLIACISKFACICLLSKIRFAVMHYIRMLSKLHTILELSMRNCQEYSSFIRSHTTSLFICQIRNYNYPDHFSLSNATGKNLISFPHIERKSRWLCHCAISFCIIGNGLWLQSSAGLHSKWQFTSSEEIWLSNIAPFTRKTHMNWSDMNVWYVLLYKHCLH